MKIRSPLKFDKILIFLFFWNQINFLYKKKNNFASLNCLFEKFIWKKHTNFFNKITVRISINTDVRSNNIFKNYNKTGISFLTENYSNSFKNNKLPQLFLSNFMISKYYHFSKLFMFFLTIHYKFIIDIFLSFNFRKSSQTALINFLNFQKTNQSALLKFNVKFL